MEIEFIGFVVGAIFAAILFLFVITMVILMLFGVKLGRSKTFKHRESLENADAGLSKVSASLMIPNENLD